MLSFVFNLGKALFSRTVSLANYYYGVGYVDQEGYLSYLYNGKRYLVPVITSQGPIKFFNALEGEENVTLKIEPYAGPKRDFYGRNPTPSDFGYEELTFFTPKGYLKFSAAEPIVLEPSQGTFE